MSRLLPFAHHAPVWNTYDCCCCCYGHFDCHSCVKVLVWIRVYRRSLKSKIFVSHSSCYHFVIWWWLLPLCVKVFCIHVKPWVWLRVSRQPEGGGGLLAAPLFQTPYNPYLLKRICLICQNANLTKLNKWQPSCTNSPLCLTWPIQIY